jgi:hypothetical protein
MQGRIACPFFGRGCRKPVILNLTLVMCKDSFGNVTFMTLSLVA